MDAEGDMSQFSKGTIGNVFKIKCPAVLDVTTATDFSDQSKAWMMSPTTHFALDFSDVLSVNRDFYRAVIQFKTVLKADGKVVCSFGFSDSIIKQLRDDGIVSAFSPFASLKEISETADKPKSSMSDLDTEFVKAFIRSTKTTFEVQCHTPLQIMTPYFKDKEIPGTSISAVMPLISNGWAGNFSICFPKAVFLQIYENMFGEKHTEITPEIEDAAAEFSNIIYGGIKTEFNPKGHNFQPALPKVMVGENLKLRRSGARPAIIVPFGTSAGQFHIEVEFEK